MAPYESESPVAAGQYAKYRLVAVPDRAELPVPVPLLVREPANAQQAMGLSAAAVAQSLHASEMT